MTTCTFGLSGLDSRRSLCVALFFMQQSSSQRALGLCAVLAFVGCNIADDDDDPAVITAGGTGGDASQAECLDAASQVAGQCAPGQDFFVEYNGGSYNMTLIDDPSANIGVGPNGWLVQVSSSADWVGNYGGDLPNCDFGCAWCPVGFSVCHGGFDANGDPTCWTCFDGSMDGADQVNACANFLDAAACEPGSPPGGDDGGTTGGAGGSVGDESGGGGADTSGGLLDFDCSDWNPTKAAYIDGKKIHVDLDILEDLVMYSGAPLADCDGTRFAYNQKTGLFQLTKQGEEGLLSAMGLKIGDEIEAINGQRITSADDAASMVFDLFYSGAPTQKFSLTLQRRRERVVERVQYWVVAE